MKNDSKADLKTWNLNQILLVKAFSRYIVHTTEEISIFYLAAQVHLWSSSSSWELSTLILPMLVKALFNLQRCRHGLYYLQYLHHYIIIFLKTTSLMLNYILHRIGLYISTARNTSIALNYLSCSSSSFWLKIENDQKWIFNYPNWIAEWYHTWLWTLSSNLSDAKLFITPKQNIFGFFMILFGLLDSILLFVC